MNSKELTKVVSEGVPSDINRWNALAEENDNLVQSTHLDAVQHFFKEVPLYFELWENGEIAAGVKVYFYENTRIPLVGKFLSRHMIMIGEALVREPSSPISGYIQELSDLVYQYIQKKKVVYFRTKGMYDHPDRQLFYPVCPKFLQQDFLNTYIDLKQTIQDIRNRIQSHHQRKIRTAEKLNLQFVQEDNIDAFKDLIFATYQNQTLKGPDLNYLERFYHHLKKQNLAELFFVREGDTYLAGALNTFYGKTVYYSFGGTLKTNSGAGAFLHWELIKHYQNRGFEKYFLGTITLKDDYSAGVNRFKSEFDPEKVEICDYKSVFHQKRYEIWQVLVRLLT
jgi:hypothetical protein